MRTIGGTCSMCGIMWRAADVPDEYLIPVDLCPRCYEKVREQQTATAKEGGDVNEATLYVAKRGD